jgi:hypothetical protein
MDTTPTVAVVANELHQLVSIALDERAPVTLHADLLNIACGWKGDVFDHSSGGPHKHNAMLMERLNELVNCRYLTRNPVNGAWEYTPPPGTFLPDSLLQWILDMHQASRGRDDPSIAIKWGEMFRRPEDK